VSYFPDQDLVFVVLQNSTGPAGPGVLLNAFVDLALGPEPPPAAVPFQGSLDVLLGEYAGPVRGRHAHVTVTRDGDQIVFAAPGQGGAARPVHVGEGVWADGGTRRWFVVADGRALELRVSQGAGHYVLRRVK
jgi:hypothetical protein